VGTGKPIGCSKTSDHCSAGPFVHWYTNCLDICDFLTSWHCIV